MALLRTMFIILSLPLLAANVQGFEGMDRRFIFFPDRTLHATPAAAGLTYEEVRFPASDGVSLHGWYLPGDSGKPLVLFAHGNAGNLSHRIDNLAGFHRLGLPVFIFDYRGYGRSEGRPSEKGTYADMRGALAWLKKQGWKTEQMIYFGRSLGAAVALNLALEEPPAGLVMESAFTSVAEMGWHLQPMTYALLGWWAISSRYDNLAKIGGLRSPLLLFHGEDDTIVPPEMARQLLEKAPSPKSLYLIPGADHNDPYYIDDSDYWRQWQEFIKSLVPGPGSKD
ncbi:MAG: alpha/beta hydrolase [Syntrophotaleaceae bacterium]